MKKTVAIIQARMGSSRLPGKSLRPIGDQLLIGHVIRRARAIVGVDDVAVATSTMVLDDPLVEEALRLGCYVHRGSERDVLDRMTNAAIAIAADIVIRVTGDCPLLAPDVAAQVLALHAEDPSAALTSNDTLTSGYPDGMDVEVTTTKWLIRAASKATDQWDREHVTPWLRREASATVLKCDVGDFRALKLSVDRPEDLERVRRVMKVLPDRDYSLAATIEACRQVGVL